MINFALVTNADI